MTLISNILEFNKEFVDKKKYEPYKTTKFPDKKMVVLTCMDTRLMELLPRAMNLGNGDAKFIKNAGAVVSHPFGSIMRSILVSVYGLNAKEICVVGHHDCGMVHLHSSSILDKTIESGISEQTIDTLNNSGIDLKEWLKGFDSVEESVKESVNMIRKHPLIANSIPVHGMVVNPETGELTLLTEGY